MDVLEADGGYPAVKLRRDNMGPARTGEVVELNSFATVG